MNPIENIENQLNEQYATTPLTRIADEGKTSIAVTNAFRDGLAQYVKNRNHEEKIAHKKRIEKINQVNAGAGEKVAQYCLAYLKMCCS